MRSQFLYNPAGKGLYCHAPTLLHMPSGELLAAWYAYPEAEHADASLVLARRPVGQDEWNPSVGVLDGLGYSVGNPVLFQAPGGTVWLLFVLIKGRYWNDAELAGASSVDGGVSWTAPVTLWRQRGTMVRHPPVLRGDGSLLLPAYDENARQSVLLSRREPYTQWQEAYRFADPPLIQPVLVCQAPRQLGLFFRPTAQPRRIWRSGSGDDGTTWSVPVRTMLPTSLSGIAAFVLGGQIALVYNHTEEHQRHPTSWKV